MVQCIFLYRYYATKTLPDVRIKILSKPLTNNLCRWRQSVLMVVCCKQDDITDVLFSTYRVRSHIILPKSQISHLFSRFTQNAQTFTLGTNRNRIQHTKMSKKPSKYRVYITKPSFSISIVVSPPDY